MIELSETYIGLHYGLFFTVYLFHSGLEYFLIEGVTQIGDELYFFRTQN